MNNGRKAFMLIMLIDEFIRLAGEYEPVRTNQETEEVISALTMVGLNSQEILEMPCVLVIKILAKMFGDLDFTLEELDKVRSEEDEQDSTDAIEYS
jgi:hypothetical protein